MEKTREWLSARIGRIYSFNYMIEDFNVLSDMLKKHPNYETWKHKNPAAFRIERKQSKSLCLYVSFIKENVPKGSSTLTKFRIVSWKSCVTGKATKSANNANALSSAMRYAIRVQIKKIRRERPQASCDLCNSDSRIEIDHYPIKFHTLRDNFISNRNDIPQKFKWHPKRGNFIFAKDAKKFKTAWQRYHNKHASYRYLCSNCNKKT